MNMLINATITTPTKTIFAAEVLDVGRSFYFIENKNLFAIKKNNKVSVVFEDKTDAFDNSSFIGKKEIALL